MSFIWITPVGFFPAALTGTPLSLKAIFGSLPLIQYELRPGGRPGLNVLQQWDHVLDQVNVRAVENKAIVEHRDGDSSAAA